MFYNELIRAFLEDESLFTDVKAIVDCPLKVAPSEIIYSCREKQPKEILELLDAPGSDLETPVLVIPPECKYGRDSFLKSFSQQTKRKNRLDRRMTLDSGEVRRFGRTSGGLSVSPSQRSPERHAHITAASPKRADTLSPADASQDDRRGRLLRTLSKMDRLRSHQRDVERQILRHVSIRAGHVPTSPGKEFHGRDSRRRCTVLDTSAVHLAGLMEYEATDAGEELSALSRGCLDEGIEKLAADTLMSSSTRDAVLEKYFLKLQSLGMDLVQLWRKFYRQVSSGWAPDRNSLIPLPHPFIVPGGRFIEIYYWDSYWIILGLLSSGLADVARGIIENFLFSVERFGFIPNGMRKYYLDRSQPPLLSCMLRAYYHATGDIEFITNAISLLEREYNYWMDKKHGHVLELPDPDDPENGDPCVLNRYYSLEVTPRPESYRIDVITGKLYNEFNGAADNLQEHYRAIRAGAESGWDFSSRWLRPAVEGQGESGIKAERVAGTTSSGSAMDPKRSRPKVLHKVCLVDIDTCMIIPCDLNGFLYCMEEDLAYFAGLLAREESHAHYTNLKERRRISMFKYLWHTQYQIWLDYDMKRGRLSSVISAASFVPLWAKINPKVDWTDDTTRIYLASKLHSIIKPYGIVCTNITAGLQWDSPNVWAPNHHIAVDFLCGGRFWDHEKQAKDDQGPAMAIAINWASRFINTVLDRFEFFGTCAEKYDCNRLGKSGIDGEYVTQDGFGWTNGVVLDFLEKFGTRLTPQGLFSAKRPRQNFTLTKDHF